jgi:hypothetical protein
VSLKLLDACEAFLMEFGLTPSRFGREACRDPRFIFDLRRGREPSGKVADRVFAFMRRTREAEQRSRKGTPTNGKKSNR